MFRPNHLKSTIAAGESALGVWLQLGEPSIAEIASLAGYDFLILDNEHGPASLEAIRERLPGEDGGTLLGDRPAVRQLVPERSDPADDVPAVRNRVHDEAGEHLTCRRDRHGLRIAEDRHECGMADGALGAIGAPDRLQEAPEAAATAPAGCSETGLARLGAAQVLAPLLLDDHARRHEGLTSK